MAIIQCPKGHYYEDSRDDTCPYCKKMASDTLENEDIGEQLTQYKTPVIDDEEVPTEAYGENVKEEEKTIGIFTQEERNLLTAGWLVCVKGIEKGASYPIYSGRCFVGRDEMMDIVLRGDRTISRKQHCSLVYDPRANRFFAVSGEGLVYINNRILSSTAELFENDILQLGDSAYLFIPFCKGERVWK